MRKSNFWYFKRNWSIVKVTVSTSHHVIYEIWSIQEHAQRSWPKNSADGHYEKTNLRTMDSRVIIMVGVFFKEE